MALFIFSCLFYLNFTRENSLIKYLPEKSRMYQGIQLLNDYMPGFNVSFNIENSRCDYVSEKSDFILLYDSAKAEDALKFADKICAHDNGKQMKIIDYYKEFGQQMDISSMQKQVKKLANIEIKEDALKWIYLKNNIPDYELKIDSHMLIDYMMDEKISCQKFIDNYDLIFDEEKINTILSPVQLCSTYSFWLGEEMNGKIVLDVARVCTESMETGNTVSFYSGLMSIKSHLYNDETMESNEYLDKLALYCNTRTAEDYHTYKEISEITGFSEDEVSIIFAFGLIENGYEPSKMTLSETLGFVENECKNNPVIAGEISESDQELINQTAPLIKIMDDGKEKSYKDISAKYGIDESSLRLLFTYRDVIKNSDSQQVKLSLHQIINCICNNKESLNGRISNSTMQIMEISKDVLSNDKKYTISEIGEIIGLSEEQMTDIQSIQINKPVVEIGEQNLSFVQFMQMITDNTDKLTEIISENNLKRINVLKMFMNKSGDISFDELTKIYNAYLPEFTSENIEKMCRKYGIDMYFNNEWTMCPEDMEIAGLDEVQKYYGELCKSNKYNVMLIENAEELLNKKAFSEEGFGSYIISESEKLFSDDDAYLIGYPFLSNELKEGVGYKIIVLTVLGILLIISFLLEITTVLRRD